MSDNDPISANIQGVQSLVGSRMNKINAGITGNSEGVDGEYIDELTLKLDDAELLTLAKRWVTKYVGYEAKVKLRQEACKTYYLGKQKEGSPEATDGMPIAANLLFEAEETFLPAALAKNPEPVVYSDNTEEGDKVSTDVKTMLQYHADVLVLRRKLTIMVRNWSLDFIGIIKHGWDDEIKEISSEVRDAKKFIFDPDGYVDAYGDYIGYLGERITVTADRLIELFPKHSAYITTKVQGKLGTDVTYTEWWTDDYCFYTFQDKILAKNKNQHFNWPKQAPTIDPTTGQPVLDEDGQPQTQEQPGQNHFARAKKPYTFLSVFSLGQQPHDVTSLIEQNIPNQRRISRRTEQLDFNLSRANNSQIYSENNFNQETAKQASRAFIKGHPVLVPAGGPLSEAIHDLPAQAAPDAFFRELEVSKLDLRQIFGTEGITAQQPNEDQTARGMILSQQYDNSRIGGSIGDALEQVADNIFNWWVQLYHVYYDEPHFASVMGQMKAVEYITLSAQDLGRHLVVSVSPDSMKSHDELTEMNQALELYQAGVLDPKTLLTRLNFPDPETTAESTVLWIVDKNAYIQLNFPELAQKLAQIQQQAMAQQQQAELQAQQQQMAQGQQASDQKLSQTEQAHQQKMAHGEQAFQQKQKQQELSVSPASASLSNVKLPK